MYKIDREHLPVILFGILVAYLTLFYQLGSLPFFGSDEPRYVGIAEEMWQQGDWITPTLEGHPWLEKPPLVFWMQIPSFYVFGVSEFSARLPSAFLGLFLALFLGLFAGRLGGIRVGVLTYFILLTSGLLFVFARASNTDLPLTVTFAVAMGSAFIALQENSRVWAAVSGSALGLAILAKGPVALLLMVLVFLSWSALSGRRLWPLSQLAVGLTMTIVVAAPWHYLVWLENGDNFFITYVINHHLARYATDLHHHEGPFWFYIPVLLVGFFPWLFFLGSSLRELYRRRLDWSGPILERQLFLWLWFLIPLFFFSASGSKLAGYILPTLPALAVLVGFEWERYFNRDILTYSTMKIQLALCGAFALVLSLVLIFGFHFAYGSLAVGIMVAIPILFSGIWARLEFRKKKLPALFTSLTGGMALMAAILYWQAAPVIGDFHSSKDLTQIARPMVSQENPLVLYRYFHHTARYYSGYTTTRNSIENPGELRDYWRTQESNELILLTQKSGWRELRALAQAELVEQQGNLYLARIITPVGKWDFDSLPER